MILVINDCFGRGAYQFVFSPVWQEFGGDAGRTRNQEKNLQNFAAITPLVPELFLFLFLGSVPCSSVLSLLI